MNSPTYHNPVRGMTRGTKQGLAVCAILLIALIVLSIINVGQQAWLARTLDILAGVCVAVAATFVVGGTFELEGKWYDFGVKTGGGAALLAATVFWFQPYSTTEPPPKWAVSVDFNGLQSLGDVIEVVERERALGVHDIQFQYSPDASSVRQFRPIPLGTTRTYNGRNWVEIFKKFEQDADCFRVEPDDGSVLRLTLQLARTKETTRPPDGAVAGVIRVCNPG